MQLTNEKVDIVIIGGGCVGGGAVVAGPAHAVAMMLAKQAIVNLCFIIVIYSF